MYRKSSELPQIFGDAVIVESHNDVETIWTSDKSHHFIGVYNAQQLMILGLEKISLEDCNSIRFTEDEFILVSYNGDFKSFNYNIYKPSKLDIEYMMRLIEIRFDCNNESIFYDEMSETYQINRSLFEGVGEFGNVPLTDHYILHIYTELQKFCNKIKLGIALQESMVSRAISAIAIEHKKNCLFERISNVRWDGKERILNHAIEHLGIRLPGLSSEEDELQLLRTLMVSWNLGCIYRIFGESKHEIVPFLIGPQGQGKSTYISWIAGGPRFYTSTVKSVNESQKFLESVYGKAIVELGESSSLRGSDLEKLKNFISESSEVYRRPYDKIASSYIFRHILIGTSNKPMLFIDDTGNRRYYPLRCNPEIASKSIHRFDTKNIEDVYEWEQYWAELYLMYKAEDHSWIDSKGPIGTKWAKVVSNFTIQNSVYEIIENYLDLNYPRKGDEFYVTGLYEAIKNEAITSTGQSYKEVKASIGYWLDNVQCPWQRAFSTRVKINVNGEEIYTRNAIYRMKDVDLSFENTLDLFIDKVPLDISKFVDISEVIPWMPVMYDGKVIYYRPDKPFNADDYDLSNVEEGDKVERKV